MSLSLGGIRDKQNSPIPHNYAVVVRGFEQHSEPLPHAEVVQTTDAGSLPSLAAFCVSFFVPPPLPEKGGGGAVTISIIISVIGNSYVYWKNIRFLLVLGTFNYYSVNL